EPMQQRPLRRLHERIEHEQETRRRHHVKLGQHDQHVIESRHQETSTRSIWAAPEGPLTQHRNKLETTTTQPCTVPRQPTVRRCIACALHIRLSAPPTAVSGAPRRCPSGGSTVGAT